ncbi:MAG: response regulator [Cyclobacteriaceae bacterium]
MAFRAISIDDDPMAILMVQKLTEKSGRVDLVNTYTDPVLGAAGIILDDPDILFLDIEMPDFNGIQIMNALKKPPKIIVISSNPSYQQAALDLNAVAFLHKPLDEASLKGALDKIEKGE